jgi:outer membrane protein TolC
MKARKHLRLSFLNLGVMFCLKVSVGWAQNSGSQSSVDSQRLSLKEFIAKAVLEGPGLGESQAKVDFSKARENLVRSMAWPQGKIDYYFGAAPSASGNAVAGSTNFSQWGLSQSSVVELALPIYTFGALSQARVAAESGTFAEKALLDRERLLLKTQVAEIYYGYQLAFEFMELADSIVSKLEEAQNKGRKISKVKASDLDKLEVFILDTKARLIEAEKSKNLMRLAMQWKLGCAEQSCDIKWDTANLTERPQVKIDDLEKLKKESLLKRPEIIAAQKNLEARRALVYSEEAQAWPGVFLGLQLQKTWTTQRDDQTSPFAYDPLNDLRAIGGIGIRWNLNFFEKSSKLAMARAELLKAEAIYRNASEGLKADFDRVTGEKKFLAEALNLRTKAAKLAKRIFLDSVVGFTLGTATAKEILESLGAYGLAEKSRLETLYQNNVQDFKWGQVMGVDLVE